MRKVLSLIAAACLASSASAQINFNGTSYTELFDTLPTTGTTNTWTNNSTITGAFAFQSVGPAAVTNIRAGDGSSNTGALYSFGNGTTAERAWGTISSGTPGNFAYGLVVQNNTGSAQNFSLSYTGEQWRDGGAAIPNAQSLTFTYKTQATLPSAVTDWDPASAVPTGYTSLATLDFTSPTFTNTGSGAAVDGNNVLNQTPKTSPIPVTVNPGEYLILRWFDVNNAGNDHGLAIDNLTVSLTPVPEPATVLGIAAAGFGAARVIRRRVRPAAK